MLAGSEIRKFAIEIDSGPRNYECGLSSNAAATELCLFCTRWVTVNASVPITACYKIYTFCATFSRVMPGGGWVRCHVM
jgi:hypothetical protein